MQSQCAAVDERSEDLVVELLKQYNDDGDDDGRTEHGDDAGQDRPTNGMNAARNVNTATGMTSEPPAINTARAITTASITPRKGGPTEETAERRPRYAGRAPDGLAATGREASANPGDEAVAIFQA